MQLSTRAIRSVAGVFALSLMAAGPALGASGRPAAAPQRVETLKYLGTTNLRADSQRAAKAPTASSSGHNRVQEPLRPKVAPASAVTVPNPTTTFSVVTRPGGTLGFTGLTALDSHNVNGFDVEPPDQGLCAEAGTVMESVNLALQVYSENGSAYTHPVSLNTFFGLPPAVDTSHNPATYGPFLSDPRCYFDLQTRRWYVTVLEIDVNPYTGALGYRSSELIAVSQTPDPTGNYGLFSIDTTNDGSDNTIAQPNCPCFGDYPRIGADANGFYISADSYPIQGTYNSNGGMLYAVSKRGLAFAASGGGPMPPVAALDLGATPIDGYPANAVQPTETPQGASYAPDREYFLSTPDFNGFATMGGQGAKAVVLWTLENTKSLDTNSPTLSLSDAIVPSEPYAPPAPATQKNGPLPLGSSLGYSSAPTLSVNDDRMQQAEYLGGHVFSTLNTGIGTNGRVTRSAVAWFNVQTSGTSGTIARQGYVVGRTDTTLLYPSIGLTKGGKGAMTFSLASPTRYPSAGFVRFSSASGPAAPIYVNGPGARPEDGFTCYSPYGPPCRWGDYSAAGADGNRIVMADEMIPNVAREPEANWGTFVSVFKP